mgnify:FL=1
MSQLLMALPGKGSGAMQEVYRRAARMNPAGPEFWLKFPPCWWIPLFTAGMNG